MEVGRPEARGPGSSLPWTLLPCPALPCACKNHTAACSLITELSLPLSHCLVLNHTIAGPTLLQSEGSCYLPTIYIVPSHPETYFVWPLQVSIVQSHL